MLEQSADKRDEAAAKGGFSSGWVRLEEDESTANSEHDDRSHSLIP